MVALTLVVGFRPHALLERMNRIPMDRISQNFVASITEQNCFAFSALLRIRGIMVWVFRTGVQGGFADRIRGQIQEAYDEEELYSTVQG